MIHPSYTEIMEKVNSDVEEGEQKVVNSRYSIVLATAKRARQLIDGADPLIERPKCPKPLSIAVEELYNKKINILTDEEADKLEAELEERDVKEAEEEAKKLAEEEAAREENEAEEAENANEADDSEDDDKADKTKEKSKKAEEADDDEEIVIDE
ncbi:MAG: DNA-directed RNA polymerase subunit omega [Lachnospiraceae bacterium]|jgi:DNA-directed RNA polymerase subunit omega|nr:DNA-directed RNA polymerase subunit omega [Lachnospiraceae bacterium]MEE3460916.1 DNA-directed RNA polymerase subunit omega [Lachnospiraceae bacterium]